MNWYDRLLVYMMNEFMLWHQDDSVEDGSMYACMHGWKDGFESGAFNLPFIYNIKK